MKGGSKILLILVLAGLSTMAFSSPGTAEAGRTAKPLSLKTAYEFALKEVAQLEANNTHEHCGFGRCHYIERVDPCLQGFPHKNDIACRYYTKEEFVSPNGEVPTRCELINTRAFQVLVVPVGSPHHPASEMFPYAKGSRVEVKVIAYPASPAREPVPC